MLFYISQIETEVQRAVAGGTVDQGDNTITNNKRIKYDKKSYLFQF